MQELPHVSAGVPVKQIVTFDNETHDNFFLLKVKTVDHVDRDGVRITTHHHLFTLKELNVAVQRYNTEYDVGGRDVVSGYTHLCTLYCKRNKSVVTMHFCKFKGDQVPGMEHGYVYALFSPREMKRSEERVRQYFKIRHMSLRRLCKWIIGKLRAVRWL